ncbi:hypothetical protein HDU85_004130 [Gaertneriomyces sp. JEL0708]|nr:hypothetical protein HDU85_004130 [Gaertneriomyces sp. JEL0708]
MAANGQFVVLGCIVYCGQRTVEPFATYAIFSADRTVRDAKASLINQLNARGREIIEFRRLRKEILLPQDMRDFTAVDVFCDEASVVLNDEDVNLGDVFRVCNKLADYEGVVNCAVMLSGANAMSGGVGLSLLRGMTLAIPPPYAAGPLTDPGTTVSDTVVPTEDSVTAVMGHVDIERNKTAAAKPPPFYKRKKRMLEIILAIVVVVIVASVSAALVGKNKKSERESATDNGPTKPPTTEPVQFDFGRKLRSYNMAGRAFPLGKPASTMFYDDGTLYLPTVEGAYRGLNTGLDSEEYAASAPTFSSLPNCTTLNHLTRLEGQNNAWTAVCMRGDNGGELRIWEGGREVAQVFQTPDNQTLAFSWTSGVSTGDIFGVARRYAADLSHWFFTMYQMDGATKSAKVRLDLPANRFLVASQGRLIYVVGEAQSDIVEVDVTKSTTSDGLGKRTFPSIEGRCWNESDTASWYPDIFMTARGTRVVLVCYLEGNVIVHQWEVATRGLVASVPLSSRRDISFGTRSRDVLEPIAPIVLKSVDVMLGLDSHRQQARAWNVTSGALLGSYDIGGEALSWAISADDTKLFIATAARQVQVVELVTPAQATGTSMTTV